MSEPVPDDGTIDEVDRRLIRCLQENPRTSYAAMAREIGISEATTRRRVEALMSSGVASLAMLHDLYRLGYTTSAFVALTVDLDRLQDIAEQLAAFPDTTMVAATMGRYDLIIFVATRSVQELSELVSHAIAAIPGVRSTETFVTPTVFKILRDWRLPTTYASEDA